MFNQKIEIKSQKLTKGTNGEESIAWDSFAFAWANVNYKGGREGFYARQVVATGDVVFKIRHIAGVKETMQIWYDGRKYDINHITKSGRMEVLEITATMHDNE